MSEATTKPETETLKREVGEFVRVTLPLDSATVKAQADGVFEAIITTNAIDRQQETIETNGVDITNYMKNPVVLYGHDYQGLPIGKTLKLTQMANKIKAQFQLAVEEYPFAATVGALIKGGYLNAVSIGGIVRQWSEDYTKILKMDMAEYSVVPVPANAQALITTRSIEQATGKSVDTVKAEYQDFVHRSLLDSVSVMGNDEIDQAIKTLENLLVTLKESAKASPSVEAKEVKRIKRVTIKQNAAAVAAQSERVIKLIKLKDKE